MSALPPPRQPTDDLIHCAEEDCEHTTRHRITDFLHWWAIHFAMKGDAFTRAWKSGPLNKFLLIWFFICIFLIITTTVAQLRSLF